MLNKKVHLPKALKTLNNHFMKGGNVDSKCKQGLGSKNCSINGAGLRPDWCELDSNNSCIYSAIGKQNIDYMGDKIFQRINYYNKQGQKELIKILKANETKKTELKAICNLFDISDSGTKKDLIQRILNHRTWSVLNDFKIWSYTLVGDD